MILGNAAQNHLAEDIGLIVGVFSKKCSVYIRKSPGKPKTLKLINREIEGNCKRGYHLKQHQDPAIY